MSEFEIPAPLSDLAEERLILLSVLQELTVAAFDLFEPRRPVADFLGQLASRLGCLAAVWLESTSEGAPPRLVSSTGISRVSRDLPLPPVPLSAETGCGWEAVELPYPEITRYATHRWVFPMESGLPLDSQGGSCLLLYFSGPPRLDAKYRGLVRRLTRYLETALRHRRMFERTLQAERELRTLNSDLEERVLLRTEELSLSNRQLDARLDELVELNQALEKVAAALRGSEARLRVVLDSGLDAVIGIGVDGRIVEWNSRAEQTFGLSRSEAMGCPLVEAVVPPQHREAYRHHLQRLLALDDRSLLDREVEITAWRQDGAEFPANLVVTQVGHGSSPLYIGFVRDISRRRDLEEQLHHAQRMEAVGRLAGGVAHDFNNLLTVIIGRSELLLARVGDPVLHQEVEAISRTANRAAALTGQLLAYSRRQMLQPEILDVNHVVQDMEKMLQSVVGESVRLVLALAPHLGAVRADPVQMQQVLLHLAVNARDAMPQGGCLFIETGDVSLDESHAHRIEGTAGPHVMLAVRDEGCGMDAETASHLFEPFFTTKGVGSGTGLGLATVHGIVKQSAGAIEVLSTPSEGSTFRIYLPRVTSPIRSEPQVRRPREKAAANTVLLVEDEGFVRDYVSTVLKQAGYTVVEAGDGLEALEILGRDSTPPVDLVVTDLVMPRMGGRQLIDRLRDLALEVDVLYVSGYTAEIDLLHTGAGRRVGFLEKPFKPDALLRKVRGLLGAASPEGRPPARIGEGASS